MPLGEIASRVSMWGRCMCAGSCAVRIEERGRLLPALHANATGPSRRRLGAVGASCNRLSCAPVLRHRKSERGVRNSLVRGSTCARANSAKKRAGAVFSRQRAAKQTTYSLNNMARITLVAALFGGAAAQSTVGCVPASAPLVVVFFCARRRLTLPPPAQPLAEDCRLRVGLGR